MFIFYAFLPYVYFPFLHWIKFCSGYFRQFFFSFERQKKVVAGRVRQVVILHSNDSAMVVLDEWLPYRGGHLTKFGCSMLFIYRAFQIMLRGVWGISPQQGDGKFCWGDFY